MVFRLLCKYLSVGCADEELGRAIVEGESGRVKELLDSGAANALAVHQELRIPMLFVAVKSNHAAAVQHLVRHGAKPLGEHLVFAAGHDYGSVVDVLLALPNSKALLEARAGQERYTPLIAAVSAGAESIVKSLLVRGASTAAQTEISMSGLDPAQLERQKGSTAVHVAVEKGHVGILELLLARGNANPDVADKFGSTPLMVAAEFGSVDAAKMLLAKGADVNRHNSPGLTPLLQASWSGHTAVVKLLLEHGADPLAHSEDGQGALHYSCRKGFLDITGLLVTAGANVNAPDLHGATPLLVATNNGVVASVQQLLNLGASPNIATDAGITPLMAAVAQRKRALVEVLLEKGADVNAATKVGQTALLLAVSGSLRATSKLLIECGADVRAKNSRGESVRYLAKKRGLPKVLALVQEVLEQHGGQRRSKCPIASIAAQSDSTVTEAAAAAAAGEAGDKDSGRPSASASARRGGKQEL